MTNLTTTLNPERIYVIEELWGDIEHFQVCVCKTKKLAQEACKYLNSKGKKSENYPEYVYRQCVVVESLPDLVLLAEKGTVDTFAIKPRNNDD